MQEIQKNEATRILGHTVGKVITSDDIKEVNGARMADTKVDSTIHSDEWGDIRCMDSDGAE